MTIRLADIGLAVALTLVAAPAPAAEEVAARVLGVVVDRSELAAAGEEPETELSRL